jgi:Holliday junction resolvase RusA-like endonuclease
MASTDVKTYILPLIPPSLNQWTRKHWSASSKQRRQYMAWMILSLTEQNAVLVRGAVDVTIRFVWPDRRTRDADNRVKWILDAMRGIVIEDDCGRYVKALHLESAFERGAERTEITVRPFEEGKGC